jgi:hypothetical protein
MTSRKNTTTSRRRAEQLEMDYGTASARLKKALMLHLLQRLNEDKCFRCMQPITKPEELSIDHKESWLDVSPGLFWDLSNVAFSHLRCNTADRHAPSANRKIGMDGQAWCTKCKLFKPTDQFHKNRMRWNGLSHTCASCKAQRDCEDASRRLVKRKASLRFSRE